MRYLAVLCIEEAQQDGSGVRGEDRNIDTIALKADAERLRQPR